MAEGKGLGLTLGGTMFIHSKRTSLSPMCAHTKMPTREGGGVSYRGGDGQKLLRGKLGNVMF